MAIGVGQVKIEVHTANPKMTFPVIGYPLGSLGY
jgi:hypothetical protein